MSLMWEEDERCSDVMAAAGAVFLCVTPAPSGGLLHDDSSINTAARHLDNCRQTDQPLNLPPSGQLSPQSYETSVHPERAWRGPWERGEWGINCC